MTYMEPTDHEAALSSALSDDTAWDRLVYDRQSRVAAQEWLNGELSRLKAQRGVKRAALTEPAWREFLARQSGYERLVKHRLSQVNVSLAVEDNPVPRLRRRVKSLGATLGALVFAVNSYLDNPDASDDELEDALAALSIDVADNGQVSLLDALDLPNYRENGRDFLNVALSGLED